MLRLYKAIDDDDIFKLHSILEHLICDVWCGANGDYCELMVSQDLRKLLHYSVAKNKTFRSEIIRIYEIFRKLKPVEKNLIKKSWFINNEIEKLCNKEVKPIELTKLNKVVKNDIKPLFKWCYEKLLDKAKIKGSKLKYYQKLIEENEFHDCPCCCMIDFEAEDSDCREAYDHYLPKKLYPLASVNFKNLVPLCETCNTKRKKAKDPIEKNRVAFYPFSENKHSISIKIKIDSSKNMAKLKKEDLTVLFEGDAEKIETWDWLFKIKDRYSGYVRKRAKTNLRLLRKIHKDNLKENPDITYVETIDRKINEYMRDKYSDKKFLKIAFLEEIKLNLNIIDVY